MTQESPEHLTSARVQELDNILGKPFPVLDDGFIRVVDYMGSDSSIVQAARVSYGAGTKKVRQDRGLIRYLMRHYHTSPFEMCGIKLHVRVPMDAWRQWIRHRTASVNEYSTRYSIAIDSAQTTQPDQWRKQATTNRQGSSGFFGQQDGIEFTRMEKDLHSKATEIYNSRVDAGVAREQARKDLPLCTYTEAYWKIDLHNLLHFLALRMENNAQHEIRQYATVIGEKIVAKWCPLTWEAFLDYRLNSMSLSGNEIAIINAMNSGQSETAMALADRLGWLAASKNKIKKDLERFECEEKLKKLGITPPWRT